MLLSSLVVWCQMELIRSGRTFVRCHLVFHCTADVIVTTLSNAELNLIRRM